MNRQNKAFTLVELLVVIGIIAVLIGILLPVLGRIRHSAVSVYCMSNLRQIGQAAFIYGGSSKGFFPQACFEKSIVVSAPPRTIYTSDSLYRFSKEQAAVMSRVTKANQSIWYCRANKVLPLAGQRPTSEDDFYPPDHNRPWVDTPIQSGRILYWWLANPNPPDYVGPLTDVTGNGDFFASATPDSIAAPQYAAPAYRDANKDGSIRDEYMRRIGEKNASRIVICTDQSGGINQTGWYFHHGKMSVIPPNSPMADRFKLTRSWKNNLYGDGHVEQKRPDEVEWRFGPTNGMCW
jgi:prepilin-type N-terminal cleavage/methylation domain-containing protein